MTPQDQRELLRCLELDYDKTTKLIEGIVGSGFTIRGWAVALISALIGLTFQTRLWQVAALAAILTLLFALIDGYYSWLYAKAFDHAQKVENVLRLYYGALARGADDPKAREDFEVALLAHPFGRFAEIEHFRLKALADARPRLVILTLYGTLLACAVGSASLVYTRPGEKLECTATSGQANTYTCVRK